MVLKCSRYVTVAGKASTFREERARIERLLLAVALEAVLRAIAAQASAHIVIGVSVALVDVLNSLHAVDEVSVRREPSIIVADAV